MPDHGLVTQTKSIFTRLCLRRLRNEASVRRLELSVVLCLLLIHTGLLGWSAYCHSPVATEIGHLPAGISHWQFRRFDLYRVNPPLVRMVAALPVLLAKPATNWSRYDLDPLVRCEVDVAIDFLNANGMQAFFMYTIGRWACIPFSWVGAYACYKYSRDLFGPVAGLSAMSLWCFCPNILGHGSLLMPDVPSAALGFAACYAFWRWLRRPTWYQAAIAGVVLGLAELTKLTLLIFYPLWATLWIIYRVVGRPVDVWKTTRECSMLTAQWLLSVYIINLGYGFEGTFQCLAEYRFQSTSLQDPSPVAYRPSNRLARSVLGQVPIPLPRNYVQGIDTQRLDFERGKNSYLGGTWKHRGWWYFYLYGMALKIPIGTWLLLLVGVVGSLLPSTRSVSWRDELVLILPALVLLLVVSGQTGFSIHLRYVLPIFPFLFVWASRSLQNLDRRTRGYQIAVIGALICSIGSSLVQYPHSLSYFNVLAGGPLRGHEHLLDSSIAWGQDLLKLKAWCDAHPQSRPIHLAMFGLVNPHLAGIDFRLPAAQTELEGGMISRPPGWYVIDVNHLHNSGHTVVDEMGRLTRLGNNQYDFSSFRKLEPVDVIGYSLYVYYIPASAPPGDGMALGNPTDR